MGVPKIVSIVGARPQFVKAAAVARILDRFSGRLASVLIHTGQHYDHDLSAVFFDELPLPRPDRYLDVGSGPHGAQTGEMLRRLEPVLVEEAPDLVIVYGDTNSTLAGALAASKLQIPVAHVEAGLRCFRKEMPEEINRVVADHVSTLRFCPSPTAIANLRREGIEGASYVGDVMLDALNAFAPRPQMRKARLSRYGLAPKSYGVATVHRAENTDDPARLADIIRGLGLVAEAGVPVIAPLHPRTSRALRHAPRPPGVRFIDPVGYRDMLALVGEAKLVLTDSGGVQREAFWLGIPCVLFREETEWPETVSTGWNRLAGSDPGRIVAAALEPPPTASPTDVYGDGHASDRIVAEIAAFVGATVPEVMG